MKTRIRSFAFKILRDRHGGVAMHVALTMAVIIGMAGLGGEITWLLYKHRQMQVVADAAALSAGAVLANSNSSPGTEARAIAAHLGFVNGANGVTVTVNNPPLRSQHYTGNEKAIEVIVNQPQSLSAVRMFHSGIFDVKARATALTQGKGVCVLALQTTGIGVIINGSGEIEIEDCGVAVNSSDNQALYVTGGASLEAESTSIVGGYFVYPGSYIHPTPKTHAAATADPYADLSIPTPGTCIQTPYTSGSGTFIPYGSATLSPGTYCGGLNVGGGSVVTLNPGVYIMNNGDLNINNGATVTGSGLTFVLTGDSSSTVGTVYFVGGTTQRLTAPTAGPTAGLTFIQDPKVITNPNKTAWLNNGANMYITGAIYFPKNEINYAGGYSTEGRCFQLIANTLNFSNGQSFHLECKGYDLPTAGGGVLLVE